MTSHLDKFSVRERACVCVMMRVICISKKKLKSARRQIIVQATEIIFPAQQSINFSVSYQRPVCSSVSQYPNV